MTSLDVQKDIVRPCAVEINHAIVTELGDSCFSILVDESQDVSTKEQMAGVLGYVHKRGRVVERFFGILHVENTIVVILKSAIEAMLANYRLSISRLHGQGYDGATNMRGEFNGLKTLILKVNESASYIHCFAIKFS